MITNRRTWAKLLDYYLDFHLSPKRQVYLKDGDQKMAENFMFILYLLSYI